MRGASLLLFITDRCPVACDHCSVDSRPNSPTISDFELFGELLRGICEQEKLKVVGISGGEPFSERRGLIQACEALSAHNKSIVIYTSGVWAKSQNTLPWISAVLAQCSTVYLSTDSFHQAKVSALQFQNAALQIAKAGAWIVVQTLEVEHTTRMLKEVFGADAGSHAEVVPITPLRNGRGKQVFNLQTSLPGNAMGTCSLAVTPVVRYDGMLTSCCNEEIIMGHGPDRFRQQVNSTEELHNTLTRFKHDPIMRCVAQVGLGQLLMHPRLDPFNKQRYSNNCELCWEVMRVFPTVPSNDRLIHAIAELGEANEHASGKT